MTDKTFFLRQIIFWICFVPAAILIIITTINFTIAKFLEFETSRVASCFGAWCCGVKTQYGYPSPCDLKAWYKRFWNDDQ